MIKNHAGAIQLVLELNYTTTQTFSELLFIFCGTVCIDLLLYIHNMTKGRRSLTGKSQSPIFATRWGFSSAG